MIAPAFTPGPWAFSHAVNEYGREGGPILGTVTKGGTWHLAVLPSDLGAESEANAHLIATAPELYAMLEIAVAVIDQAGVYWMGEDSARKVLRKARGEQ